MSKTRNISDYKRLYDLLIYQRKSQTEISHILQKDKAQISRMTNTLIESGLIRCFNPRSRDKTYLATKKPFHASELYKLPTSKSQRLRGVCNIIQIQRCSFKAKTLHPPMKDNIKWDREWELNNNVRYQQFSYPFKNLGVVHFQRIKSNNSDIVKIILPRLTWERENGNPHKFLLERASECASWFKKHFQINFTPLNVCQRPDFAIPLTDPKLVDLSQHGTYRSGSIMIDSSSPDNIPEIESKDWDTIDGLSNIVPRVAKLEYEVNEIKTLIVEFRSEFQSVFSQPVRPDTREGYA